MAIFSFENGNLVPAQSVDLSVSRLGEETLTALRARVLDLIDAPLFPIAWTTEPTPSGEREGLIALDPSGQIVTIDVFARLSSEELIASLGAAGRHTDTSAEVLASLKGVSREDFEREWAAFLDVCPPASQSGPRLYLIVFAIDDDVRPAIDALAGAAVSVRQASVVGSGSQVLISIDEIHSRMTSLSSLLDTVKARAQVEATVSVDDGVQTRSSESSQVSDENIVDGNVVEGSVTEQETASDEAVSAPETSEAFAAPATVSLYADSPDSAAAQRSEFVDAEKPVEEVTVEEPTSVSAEPVAISEETTQVVDEPAVAPIVESVEETPVHEASAPQPPAEDAPAFPSRRALRRERERRRAEQGDTSAASVTSVYSFGSITTQLPAQQPGQPAQARPEQVRPEQVRLEQVQAGESAQELAQEQTQEQTQEPAQEQTGRIDSSNLTLSTFDISERPPAPTNTPDSETPTAGAPASAVSVDSALTVESTASIETAISAESAPSASSTNSDARAKAIFASLPRFFKKSSNEERRAEQLLWEQAAPMREGRIPASLISESAAASHSSDAVDEAAEKDYDL